MSKKKIILLLMSCFLIIASLSTATYAWYVTNLVTTASNISGKAESLHETLIVSTDGIVYKPSVDITSVLSSQKLEPVQIVSDNSFALLDGTTADKTKHYVSFSLYFRVTDIQLDSDFQMQLKAKLPSGKDSRLIAQGYTNDPVRRQIYVHLAEALSMEITPGDNDTKSLLASSEYWKFNEDRFVSGRDAVFYYNNVKGLEGDDRIAVPTGYMDKYESDALFSELYTGPSSTYSESSQIVLFTLEKGKTYNFKLTFNFFLDGWDVDCFDFLAEYGFEANALFSLKKHNSD